MRPASAISLLVGNALLDVREDASVEPFVEVAPIDAVICDRGYCGEDCHVALKALGLDSKFALTSRAAHLVPLARVEWLQLVMTER